MSLSLITTPYVIASFRSSCDWLMIEGVAFPARFGAIYDHVHCKHTACTHTAFTHVGDNVFVLNLQIM
ncbi:hypothetical protein VTO58DRAFT_107019 [Aureobasidium pullulans]